MSQCLVVGGGFLGSHVAGLLASEGHRVTIYSRSFNEWLVREDRSSAGSIELVEGEVPPGAALRELIDASDIVFYLSGSSTPAMAQTDPGGSIKSLVVPAAALIDLMRISSTRRVVVASSGGTVYGAVEDLPTAESYPTRPISLHGVNSLTVERYAMFFADQHGLEPVILRYSNPYGPGQLARRGQGVIAAWCEAIAHDEEIVLYGDASTRRDFIYVEDAAAATVAAGFGAPAPGIYNVGAGRCWPLHEVLSIIEAVAGESAKVRRLPDRKIDVRATQLACDLLQSETGWTPQTSIEDGIRASWEWVKTIPYERRLEAARRLWYSRASA